MNVNQFTVQDRQDYQNLKDFIHLRLKQVRGVSELIWDIGNAMVQVDRRGLWWIDMTLVQPVPRMGKGRGKQRKPTREQWADRILKVNERQARKYFKVAECLTRAEVEGTGLCLDRMEQLALTPPPLRPRVRKLGMAGASLDSMRQAREAGERHLSRGAQDPDEVLQDEATRRRREALRAKTAGLLVQSVGHQLELHREGARPTYSDRMLAAAAQEPGLALTLALAQKVVDELEIWSGEDVTLDDLTALECLVDEMQQRMEDLRIEAEQLQEEAEEAAL